MLLLRMLSTRTSPEVFPNHYKSTSPEALRLDSSVLVDKEPFITPLHHNDVLEVGDILIYEFVSIDRRWRWAIGTVIQLMTLAGGSQRQAGGVALATVRDWALTQKNNRGLENRLRVSSNRTADATADIKASRINRARHGRIPPIFAEVVVKSQELLSLAWDSVASMESESWEQLLRLDVDQVTPVTLLAVLGMLHVVGVLPVGWQQMPPSRQWQVCRACLLAEDFTRKLVHFGEHVKSRKKFVCHVCDYNTFRMQERVSDIQTGVMDASGFVSGAAVCDSTLCTRLFMWLEAQVRYFTALKDHRNAQEEFGRRNSLASVNTTHEDVSFTESLTHTTTVRSSFFAKVSRSRCLYGHYIILSPREMTTIHSLALSQHAKTVPLTPPVVDQSPLWQFFVQEATARDSLQQEANKGIYELHVLHSTGVARHLLHDLSLSHTEYRVAQESIDAIAPFQRTLAVREELCSRHGVEEEESLARQMIFCAYISDRHEYLLLSKVHEYATVVEALRYCLRQSQASHLKAADILQTELNGIIEHPTDFQFDLQRLTEAVESCVDELMSNHSDVYGNLSTAHMTKDLHQELREHYQSVLPREKTVNRSAPRAYRSARSCSVRSSSRTVSSMREDPRMETLTSLDCFHLERPEQEIVSLMNQLKIERLQRKEAERRAADMEVKLLMRSSIHKGPAASLPESEEYLMEEYATIRSLHESILRGVNLIVEADTATIKMLSDQLRNLRVTRAEIVGDGENTRADEIHLIDRRIAVLSQQREGAETDRSVHLRQEETMHQLETATANLWASATNTTKWRASSADHSRTSPCRASV